MKESWYLPTLLFFTYWKGFVAAAVSPPTTFYEGLTPLKGKVVTGIYSEETPPQFLIYEKVVPLVFEFRLRSDFWSNSPVAYTKLKLLPRLNCRSDNKSSTTTTSDWLFACPVFYHVHEFLRYYKTNFTDAHPALRTGLRLTASLEYQKFNHHPSLVFEDCEQVIARSWKGVYGRDMGMVEYRALVEKCNTLPNYFEDQITDYSYDITYLFDSMKDNFMSNFFLNASNPDPGEMINSLLAVQSLHLLNTHSEISRLNEALLSCQNQMIPYSFLKGARLEKALQEIKGKLMPLKYTVASGLTVSRLLKLPVADCIFGINTLTVQILLPVIKADVNYNFLKFSYPNFLYNDQLCSVKSVRELGKNAQPQYFLYDRPSKTLLETKCPSSYGQLCLVPDQTHRPLLNKCIYEMLNASFEAIRIRDHCSLHCEKLGVEFRKKMLPLIQRVSPTRFVIAVSKITPILVKCEGKPDEMITPQVYGGVEVTLPCNCYLMYHDEKFYSRSPCGNSLFIQHVIPDHMVNTTWSKESKFFLNDPTEKVNFSMFSDSDTVSLLDLKSITRIDEQSSGGLNETDDAESLLFVPNPNNYDNYDACFTGHVYLWVFIVFQSIVLFLVILFLVVKVNQLTKRCEYGRSTVCYSVSQMTNLDENK